ncbi:MAG: inosine/xanthosine triphosphatase [bacterium]|nr:inosine/xanthosine triphosphatase [bacterium]
MKIHIGSKNKAKIDAVTELLDEYPHLRNADIHSFETSSSVADQPKSLEETVQGAMGRAKEVFQNSTYGFGIESGLMKVPNTKSGFMDVCVCAIYDGTEYHLGLSSAWEAPKKVMEYMLNDGLNMSDAACKAGLTDDQQIGSGKGLVGIMTKGRLDRKAYTKEAIRTALIHLEEV